MSGLEALEALKKEVAGLKDLVKKAADASDHQEEVNKRLGAIEAAQEKWMKTRSLPDGRVAQMDPRLLKFAGKAAEAKGDPSILGKAFNRLLQSVPVASDKSGLNPLVEELQKASDMLLIWAACNKWAADGHSRGHDMTVMMNDDLRSSKFWQEYQDLSQQVFKATLDSQTAGEGLEFIPTATSGQIRQKLELALRVPALFEQFNMPTNPFKWPWGDAGAAQYVAEDTTAGNVYNLSAGDMIFGAAGATGDVTFNARKARAMQLLTGELSEDGVMATAGWLLRRIVRSLADGREDAAINGDTATTHQDNDITGSSVKKWFNGLRKYGVGTTGNTLDIGGTLATSELTAMMALLGRYAAEVNQLVWIVSPQVWAKQLLGLDEVKTLDNYGAGATILTGEVSRLFGAPVIPSQWVRNDVAATGVNTSGGPNTLSTILLVHRANWVFGNRPGRGVERQRMLPTDQELLASFDRADFQFISPQTDTSVAVGINVTP